MSFSFGKQTQITKFPPGIEYDLPFGLGERGLDMPRLLDKNTLDKNE